MYNKEKDGVRKIKSKIKKAKGTRSSLIVKAKPTGELIFTN